MFLPSHADPAAAVLGRVLANCAPVRAATAVGLPVAAAGTVTPVTVAPGPRRRRSATEPRPASVRSAVATPSPRGAPFRRPVPAAGPERPVRCPDPGPDRTVATETPTTIRGVDHTDTHTNMLIMTYWRNNTKLNINDALLVVRSISLRRWFGTQPKKKKNILWNT